MSRENPLTAANLYFLGQGLALLDRIDDAVYTARPEGAESPVGGHFRHCLDFYQCFLDGLATGEVDYDARCRDPEVERSREAAIKRFASVMERLEALPAELGGQEVRVSVDRACDTGDPWSRSTAGRELQFLRSHTVHHYALIAAQLRLLGVDPEPGFGVAPSTLEHRELAGSKG